MPVANNRLTLAHVTHEAVEQMGGIGTVLEGLMTSPVYQKQVGRSILIGPTSTQITVDPEERLGEHGRVLYSSIDKIDRIGLASRFRPIEWAFNVAIVYGTRTYTHTHDNRHGDAEVLLIDVFRYNPDRLNIFKLRLWERFGIDSARYEKEWDFEEYVRLAEPAYYALSALLDENHLPCILFAHEFMGLPTALAVILEGQDRFRTVFHAHECATARRLVENHPGHDTMFYNVLDQARAQGRFVDDVFGPMDHLMRHALVSRAHLCDGVIAVGDRTRDELHFLNERFAEHPIDLVYNGVPTMEVDLASKLRSRAMLVEYSRELLGYEPDVLMTHVTRPVISKGLWRDLKVCHYLDEHLGQQNQTGVLYILTSAGGVRRHQDVLHMEQQYGWPRHHRIGFPDLVGPEVDLYHDVEAFNAHHRNVQVVLVNQFGWTQWRIGRRLPADMTMSDFRRATDVEFGMATYEPFGISPLEPLAAGGICVISSVCGCEGFVRHVSNGRPTPNVLVADFTRLDREHSIEQLLAMTRNERDHLEETVARQVAAELFNRLPRTDAQREALIRSGRALAERMGWDTVVSEGLLPLLHRLRRNGKNGETG